MMSPVSGGEDGTPAPFQRGERPFKDAQELLADLGLTVESVKEPENGAAADPLDVASLSVGGGEDGTSAKDPSSASGVSGGEDPFKDAEELLADLGLTVESGEGSETGPVTEHQDGSSVAGGGSGDAAAGNPPLVASGADSEGDPFKDAEELLADIGVAAEDNPDSETDSVVGTEDKDSSSPAGSDSNSDSEESSAETGAGDAGESGEISDSGSPPDDIEPAGADGSLDAGFEGGTLGDEPLQTVMLTDDPEPRDRERVTEESPAAAAVQLNPPEFDTVRVHRNGTAVVAGRAAPRTSLQVIVNGETVQEAEVGREGQFAMVFEVDPEVPALEITLNTLTEEGVEIPSEQSVIVLQTEFERVGAAEADTAESLPSAAPSLAAEGIQPIRPALLLSSLGSVKLMQQAFPVIDNQTLVEMISYDESGEAVLGGKASGLSGIVRIYVDNAHVKDAEIQSDRTWSSGLEELLPGRYILRVDEVSLDGAVVGRVEMPLQKEGGDFVKAMLAAAAESVVSDTGVDAGPLPQLVTVQRGYTLWGISRNRFGLGRLYVNIFDLNKDQIRDPDLIYPGQIFKMPQADNLFDPEYGRAYIPDQPNQ